MKKIPLIVWIILICLVLVHYFYTPEKPEIVTGEMLIDLTHQEAQPNLENLWDTLVREQAFSNESAVLLQMNQYIVKNGVIESTHLYFTGEKDREQYLYEVYAYPEGNISFKSQKFEGPLEGAHPLAILREIDSIDFGALGALSPGESNVTLQTLKHEGEKAYNQSHSDLYAFSNGSLRPLKKVTFPHGSCWYTIKITRLNEPGVEQPERNTTSEVISDHIIVFIEQDLALADTVISA